MHVYVYMYIHNYYNMTIHDSIIAPRVMHFSAFIVYRTFTVNVVGNVLHLYTGFHCH